MTVKRRRERIFVADGVEEEERAGHWQTSEEIYWTWSSLASEFNTETPPSQGTLSGLLASPRTDAAKTASVFFQKRFSDWNWILLPFPGKKKLRPQLTSLNFLQKLTSTEEILLTQRKVVRFRCNWVLKDPTLAPSTEILQQDPSHSQKMPFKINNSSQQFAFILQEPVSTSHTEVQAGNTWELWEWQDKHLQERSGCAAAATFGQDLLKQEHMRETSKNSKRRLNM